LPRERLLQKMSTGRFSADGRLRMNIAPDSSTAVVARVSPQRAAFGVALLFSFAAALHAFWFAKQFPDELQYWDLANNLARTGMLTVDGVSPSAVWPPLLPWLLTPLAAAGLPLAAGRVFVVLLYFVSGLLTARLLANLAPTRRWLAPVGTALVLANPVYFFAAGNLYPQLVLTPLFVAALWLACVQPSSTTAGVGRAAGIGGLLGVSLLAAASALFSFMPLLALLAWEDLRSVRRGAAAAAYRRFSRASRRHCSWRRTFIATTSKSIPAPISPLTPD
jgi:hypothetical protein